MEEGDSSSDGVASESPIKHSRCEDSAGAASNLFDDYGQFLTLAANPTTAYQQLQPEVWNDGFRNEAVEELALGTDDLDRQMADAVSALVMERGMKGVRDSEIARWREENSARKHAHAM